MIMLAQAPVPPCLSPHATPSCVATEKRGSRMPESIIEEIQKLRQMTVGELRARYAEVFGEEPRSRNKDYLWKRIAYRIQERAEGGLSERARRRAAELARDEDLRVRPPSSTDPTAWMRDPRVPTPGTILKRSWAGTEHVVQVLDIGFLYEGRRFKSLSAAARAITGTRWNGFLFFGLIGRKPDGAGSEGATS